MACVQVQYAQRNVTANAQRKYISSFRLTTDLKAEDDVTPTFPVELKDVTLMSWSPSGKGQPKLLSAKVFNAIHLGPLPYVT